MIILVDAVKAEKPVDFSPGNQVLDFIHVDDIADFFYTLILSLDNLKDSYYQFHLGTGEGHSLRGVADMIESVEPSRKSKLGRPPIFSF